MYSLHIKIKKIIDRCIRLVVVPVYLALIPGIAKGQGQVPESLVKAALIYNISKYTEWPQKAFSGTRDTLSACILGQRSLVDALRRIEGRLISGRRLSVIRATGRTDFATCHILVVSSDMFGQAADHLLRLRKHPILTISDRKGFAERHGAIELVLSEGRIGFKANTDRLGNAGLILSSKVLGLAQEILPAKVRK